MIGSPTHLMPYRPGGQRFLLVLLVLIYSFGWEKKKNEWKKNLSFFSSPSPRNKMKTTSSCSCCAFSSSSFKLSSSSIIPRSFSYHLKLKPLAAAAGGGGGGGGFRRGEFPRLSVQCCNNRTGGGRPSPSSDENGSKSVLDAFFLGKALAEAINERIESSVGELLSTVGRLQAEQQKQVQEFQEEVKDRAKKAKEKAAQESLEAQRRFSTYTTSAAASSDTDVAMVEISSSVSEDTVGTTNNSVNPSNGDILLGMMNDE